MSLLLHLLLKKLSQPKRAICASGSWCGMVLVVGFVGLILTSEAHCCIALSSIMDLTILRCKERKVVGRAVLIRPEVRTILTCTSGWKMVYIL